MILFLDIIVFAVAVSLKGGWHKRFFTTKIDGTHLSFILIALYAWYMLPLGTAVMFTLGWMLISASMGEEAGAVGDYKAWWGDYEEAIYPPGHSEAGQRVFDRSYGIKKGIQYGLQTGSVMALSLGNWSMAIAGALFPVAYYLGSSLYYYLHRHHAWTYAEPVWGVFFGVAFYLSRIGFLDV